MSDAVLLEVGVVVDVVITGLMQVVVLMVAGGFDAAWALVVGLAGI